MMPDYQEPSNHDPHTHIGLSADLIGRPSLDAFVEERASSIHDPDTEVLTDQTKEQRKRDCHQLQNTETLMINELGEDDYPSAAEFIELPASHADLIHERHGCLARFGMHITDRQDAHGVTADHTSNVVGKLTASQKIRLRKKKKKTGTVEDT